MYAPQTYPKEPLASHNTQRALLPRVNLPEGRSGLPHYPESALTRRPLSPLAKAKAGTHDNSKAKAKATSESKAKANPDSKSKAKTKAT